MMDYSEQTHVSLCYNIISRYAIRMISIYATEVLVFPVTT